MSEFAHKGIVGILAFSLTLNLGLGWYVFKHSGGFARAEARQGPIENADAFGSPPIKVGSPAPEVVLTSLTDRSKHVASFAGRRPTLLYVLTPTCGWCRRNTQNLAELWRQKSGEFDFVGVSLARSGLAEYLRVNPVPFEVGVVEPETIRAYGLGVTPALILITDGRVSKKWNGAWSGDSQLSIERYFKVVLPGLSGGQR